jgi:hypothetical protein
MSKAKKPGIADEILSRVQNYKPGFGAWHCELPDDVRTELEALRERWVSGELGLQKRALARSIIASLRDRGLPVSGIQGVEHWLTANRRR